MPGLLVSGQAAAARASTSTARVLAFSVSDPDRNSHALQLTAATESGGVLVGKQKAAADTLKLVDQHASEVTLLCFALRWIFHDSRDSIVNIRLLIRIQTFVGASETIRLADLNHCSLIDVLQEQRVLRVRAAQHAR